MRTRFVEATNGFNCGRFMLGTFDHGDDQARNLQISGDLLARWNHVLIFDLVTGEGALFRPGGHGPADLEKHAIWVCPMFPPFLDWFHEHARQHRGSVQEMVDAVPAVVQVDPEGKQSSLYGRRHGEGLR